MSLSLEDLKSELRENYQRIEEVLSGMDNYIVKLEKRVINQEERIKTLEGQLASLAAALTEDIELDIDSASTIVLGKM
jgi:predicted RNase H-like nuclease (RuvC/YqgF family)